MMDDDEVVDVDSIDGTWITCGVRVHSFREMADHRCELSSKKPSDN